MRAIRFSRHAEDQLGDRGATKQVMPIVVEEKDRFVVVTVYVFYFGGNS